jgi:hypothetical protein
MSAKWRRDDPRQHAPRILASQSIESMAIVFLSV